MSPDLLIEAYEKAKDKVNQAGHSEEVVWQDRLNFQEFSESDLLREAAWVIFCSGFRESVVRKKFDQLSLSFCDWESAASIVENEACCKMTALWFFGNEKKIEAVIEVARQIEKSQFALLKARILENPIQELTQFPFIGSVTVLHLAKNLGFPVAKPDRHLLRIADKSGYADVQDFCQTLSKWTGDSIQKVDIVLWRFATLDRNYLNTFSAVPASIG